MRAVVQRVMEASVSIEGEVSGKIQHGLMVLLGMEEADAQEDCDWLVRKISQMRIFEDEDGKMNQSILDVSGSALVVSQFTLHASTKKGNRPSFIKAAKPDHSEPLYDKFVSQLGMALSKPCETGRFGADMKVSLINDGPVTIIIDSKAKE